MASRLRLWQEVQLTLKEPPWCIATLPVSGVAIWSDLISEWQLLQGVFVPHVPLPLLWQLMLLHVPPEAAYV
jgi:hypothetical protein